MIYKRRLESTVLESLLNELQLLQNEVIDIVSDIAEEDYDKQFHPDLSPIGWHLGHCIFIELYWIRERCLQQSVEDSIKSLYIPEMSYKPSRGAGLPEKTVLLEWAQQKQSENYELLTSLLTSKNNMALLENNFLIYFLIQHYSQHIETMCMILTERQRQLVHTNLCIAIYQQQTVIAEFNHIEAGIYNVGSNNRQHCYDNEQPMHSIELKQFNISRLPVSNKEYKQFVNEEGYSNKDFWSDQGWSWINNMQFKCPHHWYKSDDTNYYGVDHHGSYSLEDNQPVHGLSYYEAEAYANWKGARLPHEHEWEVAALNNQLQQSGLVWEWCSNTFFPYNHFKSYPYDGYSVPYFDGKHHVLRGGSRYTKERIKRPSFRNYYTADKRHIFAGLRLIQG